MDTAGLKPKMVLAVLHAQYETRGGNAANKDRKNLVAAWNWGIKYHELPEKNPCKVDRFSEVRQDRYVLPVEDFWKIYELTFGQDNVMLSAFLYLAARRGEIFDLREKAAEVIKLKVRLEKRSQMVLRKVPGKKSSKEGFNAAEPDFILPST